MSEHSTPEERTEAPTERRMGEIRKEGAMPLSTDVVQVVSLITGFFVLKWSWEWLISVMRECFTLCFDLVGRASEMDIPRLQDLILLILVKAVPPVMLLAVLIAIFAALAVMLQTDWCVKEKKIHFRLTMLNPINGIKRILSISGFVQTAKALLKLGLILPIGYFALEAVAPEIVMLMHLSIPAVMDFTGVTTVKLFWRIMYVLIALAIFDYVWTNFQWLKNNRMTKDEVKDERKALEGDETTKRRIQAKGLQRIAQRMAVTTLEWLHHDFGVTESERLDFDDAGL